MNCRQCGANIEYGATVCPSCGAPVAPPSAPPTYNNPVVANSGDAPNVGFMVLSIFFPVVGLILYLVWKNEYPLKAKSCGKGAIIGVCVEVGLGIILGIVIACAGLSLLTLA